MEAQHSVELGQIRTRVDVAMSSGDHSAALGAAKELVESTCKIVLVERSVTFNDRIEGPALVKQTMAALELPERLAGAGDEEIKRLVSGLVKAGIAVFEVRNRVGTGHGRATTPVVTSDLAVLGVGGARLWSDWAIHRLERLLAGDVDQLIAEIGGSVFYQGTLDTRFEQVKLNELTPLDQRRIGVAVAHRARGGTFMVSIPGLRTAAERPSSFPTQYRVGLVEGCLLTADGHLHPTSISSLAILVGTIDKDEWELIVDEAAAASWSHELMSSPTNADEIARAMDEVHGGVSRPHQPGWKEVSDAIRVGF